jgi:hypothetical protein
MYLLNHSATSHDQDISFEQDPSLDGYERRGNQLILKVPRQPLVFRLLVVHKEITNS